MKLHSLPATHLPQCGPVPQQATDWNQSMAQGLGMPALGPEGGEGQGKLFHERLFGSEKAAGHCPDHGTPKRVLRVTSGSARTQRPAPWRPGAGAGTAPRP